ncbi:MAG: LuxR C-terminal-related transcriptional regulator [Oscillospiraceae bacterium]|nr:LuxR C-terminal-related transcriptional regulator [Oscillospiraceae bacterium]
MNENTTSLPQSNSPEHIIRPRMNALLEKAIEKPLVVIEAGTGYGKTRAVADFVQQCDIPAMWMQLSKSDNVGTRFWESFANLGIHVGENVVKQFLEFGFPDTENRLKQLFEMRFDFIANRRFILVFDDLHLINNPAVLRFIERDANELPSSCTMIMICREMPQINIANLEVRDMVYHINEEDLNFTERELDNYLQLQEVSPKPQTLHKIFQDTRGWAFSVNLIARSLKKSPAYPGYTRPAIKHNIFKLIEAEVWSVASERLQRFWLCLSLIEHLSIDLVTMLANGDEELLTELQQQSAYVRYDNEIGAYLIHHLFLDFLHTKQDMLTEYEKCETYKISADWCKLNDFSIDALRYYEEIKDYESIVSIMWKLLEYTSSEIPLYLIGIFERAPTEVFNNINFFAAMHLHALLRLNRWKDFLSMAKNYEKRFLGLPEDNAFRNHTLSLIYFFWCWERFLMSGADNRYDFDVYLEKAVSCLEKSPKNLIPTIIMPLGPWASAVRSAKSGVPREFAEAASRMINCACNASICFCHIRGLDDLLWGELNFYQNNLADADSFLLSTIEQARKCGQFEAEHRALFYTMRTAVMQGNYQKAKQSLNDIKTMIDISGYSRRFLTHDIAHGWYYYLLRQPEMIPNWLKENFTSYDHSYFIENFCNQMKARYHYLTRNYQPLLTYIDEMKHRESILYGRVEMLAIEACVYYQMNDKKAAFDALWNAYETAAPNNIVMPFIELGKDMRTLTMAAINNTDCAIPKEWLENIKRKSALYAKYQSTIISKYEKENNMSGIKALSARETEILRDMCKGLSRQEIATNQEISISTVKMNMNHIYEKLNANSMADVIRIATEYKLV